MSLRVQRCKFTQMAALLAQKAVEMGYEVAFLEVQRSPVQAEVNGLRRDQKIEAAGLLEQKYPTIAGLIAKSPKGIKNSIHRIGLAVDIALYRDGVYLTKSTDYEPLGVWWESIGGAWGGRWSDGNHFSLPYNGVK